ncbi:MAG: regulatory protein RecX [Oscillospiraceae bacterium]
MELVELKPICGGTKFAAVLSDGSSVRVSTALIADLSLYSGKEMSEEDCEQLRAASSFHSCKERALRIIGMRPMSCKEIFDRLVQKGETAEDAAACVEWLLNIHYLDDEQYASTLVRHYSAKGYGKQRVKNELYRRGISKALWDEALCEMPEMDDTVYELLCKKLKSDDPDRAELKRATDSLFRRGFAWDEIKTAVNRFKAENEENDYVE